MLVCSKRPWPEGIVTGHVRGADRWQVQAFAAMGGSVDHEAVHVEDVLARARAGMKVLMRFGSGVPDLPNLIGAYTKIGISTRQMALCTDVLLPEAILKGASMSQYGRSLTQ